ncbi:MAG: pentapeptide repeat-containing protein, partial [Candidatus Contendobacter sp.]|nr:pentapeptide repeat-containing protein [Candidatus Contendobacter sp.]
MDTNVHGLSLTQPVSVWNRPLSIEPKSFFLNLAKAAVNGVKLEMDDAFENLMDALHASGVGDQAGQVAWVLIYRALIRATADLVTDARDLFLLADPQRLPDAAAQEELSSILADHLTHCEARIDADFFDHPERFGLLADFKPGFGHWLRGLGLDSGSAAALAERLPDRFTLALHGEWLKEPERFAIIGKAIDSPFTRAVGRRRHWLQYAAWLREQVNGRMFGEAFGLRQVYVPLRAYYVEKPKDETEPVDRPVPGCEENRRIVVDLHQTLTEWVKHRKPQNLVRVVSGGPGSGKSSFCKMLAAELADTLDIPILYCPLHLIDPQADLIQAVASFVTQDRYLQGSPLDGKDGEDRLLVIFDGLDELAMQGRAASEVAQGFVDEVLRKADAFAAQGLRRQFLISGRDLAVQANASRLRHPGQVLHVLPYQINEREREGYEDSKNLLAEDQRDLWWQRYGRASGKDFAAMPEELRLENLAEITRQPLLNYLIALSHGRNRLDFTRETTLNAIYADLLQAVYERQWEGGRRHRGTGDLAEKDFGRILEEIALAVWHGDGRTATVETIHQRCQRSKLDRYLEQFQEGAKQGVTRLLTAFYFRQAGDVRGEKTFEFTHKSFGEYLVARRLMRMLDTVQTQLDRQAKDPDDGWDERKALEHWAEICGPTTIDEYVNAFVQHEVAMQPPQIWPRWQRTLCRLIESAVTHGMPMERLGLPRFQEMLRQSRNAEEALLALYFACARLTRDIVEIRWPLPTAFGEWLKHLQGQRPGPENTLVQDLLGYLDLRRCTIDIADLFLAHLVGANLSWAKLNLTILLRANLEGANLEGANLEGANL